MRRKWFMLMALALFVLAGALLTYPLVSAIVSSKYHSEIRTAYTAAIADADDAELAEQRRAAETYNALLRGEATVSAGEASAPPVAYAEQLTVGGAMCTIDIPKIGMYLPVRHGTGAETLERAVGHCRASGMVRCGLLSAHRPGGRYRCSYKSVGNTHLCCG